MFVLDEHAINCCCAHVLLGFSLLGQKAGLHIRLCFRGTFANLSSKNVYHGGFLGPSEITKELLYSLVGIVHRKCELYNVQCKGL